MVEQEVQAKQDCVELGSMPKVTVKHVLSAANAMLGSPIIHRIKDLPMQSKLVLVTLVIMIQNKKTDMSLSHVEQCYRAICTFRKTIGKLDQSEFFDVMNQLEAMAFIHLQIKKKHSRTETLVSLNVNPDEVLQAVSTVPILQEILDSGSDAIQQ
jgi:Cdc6-like AAA superfamily ATPase